MLEQELGYAGVSEECGEMERLEAVRRPCLGERGIGVEQLTNSVRAAGRSRLESVQRRVFCQQRIGVSGSAFIEGLEDRGDAVLLFRHS